MKKYKKGLILGRFQMLHSGHEYIINQALEMCEEVLIFIGSSDKSGTEENPFDYETRRTMLELIYNDKIKIAPLPDLGIGNVFGWGDYVIDSAKNLGFEPDCMIYGIEDKCEKWFRDEIKNKMSFVKVDRNDIKINASALRKYMYDNQYEKWKEYVNPLLYKYYSMLRIQLIKAYINPSKPKISFIDEDN